MNFCKSCKGWGEFDQPNLYRRGPDPLDCDPPGYWVVSCFDCDGTGIEPENQSFPADWDIDDITDYYEQFHP